VLGNGVSFVFTQSPDGGVGGDGVGGHGGHEDCLSVLGHWGQFCFGLDNARARLIHTSVRIPIKIARDLFVILCFRNRYIPSEHKTIKIITISVIISFADILYIHI